MAGTGSPPPPVITAARFIIQIDGYQVAFSELSGIKSEVEPVEYISADAKTGNIVHTKQFGKTKPPTVTLKRAVDNDTSIWAWHELALLGDPKAAQTCTLLLQDAGGQTLITYILDKAWPSKVDIAGLKAGASEVVIETVELVCDGITMQPGASPS
jgi:phage tail-like protein